MSAQNVVDRIFADAESEATAILKAAEESAAAIVSEASSRAESELKKTEEEVREKALYIREKKQAAARLESAKILLAEKRKVIDAIYEEAKRRLVKADKEDSIAFVEKLLEKYAEEGDEAFFAKDFRYLDDVKILPVVKKKGVKISDERIAIDGGFCLKGAICDKDLSFDAILKADRDEYQAKLAAELFKA